MGICYSMLLNYAEVYRKIYKLEIGSDFIHGKPLDVWAFGVTIFMLAYRYFPYDIEDFGNILDIRRKISNGEYILLIF